ncbi:zinc-dependent alcohol dehydrogenase family protein [Sphingomonas alpina]|uniref:NAD(P)-dependent alcohol dehydrogenase n=1 Tax=Sphingomonas alpina TaxID=653931 RepID=A0A7H0LJG7_9SPHN|nr:NAD(P)-dependent alcohol dehydrogenase [Sphingomonas alpina]QNQ09820.1 NAD(P)-dependent alcohol dehydrogenase [Sphingomonas alpina]
MQAIELTRPSLDALSRVQHPDPRDPGVGRILVRMKAASLNFLDLAVATGAYPGARYPNVPIADGAGEVIAVGPEVWQVAPGDRVAVHPKAHWIAGRSTAETAGAMRGVTLRGSLVEIAELDAASVVKLPGHLDWEEAATLPIAATTAWNGMVAGTVGPGSTVVLLGTGGVSVFALQLAKARGARVIITSSSDAKLDTARALGADEIFNYRADPDWDRFVIDRTHGVGADLVVETVGGDSIARSVAAVRQGGTIFTIGFLGGVDTRVDLLSVIGKAVRIQGSNTGSVADLAAATAAIGAHRITPQIERRFALSELVEGYRLMERGGHFGKIAFTLDW